ncbi:uroporphyrinogen-III C-methyltransferase [Sulfitobacter sp. F26204]|uniref:uroporphyrinogen-III C-methyltransferase n=1 Tax=Sulfitobacter sp. F26204 TaxID=2996014 RepID=UPI00225E5A41|nr:uroporphyrinogen-III C-methyltransferase [Sulfitobacter sp. F26204]MCX7558102.1 uroporphyrinogen-III C-methyltransferase [Sulfitobacter sp. F26204]
MSGYVSFVSSGPGDPELLTVKAVDRLQNADVVLFDDLSAGPILEHAGPETDLIGVGKRAGRASPKQHHVSQVLVDHAKEGLRVVRLKSGDSGLFGRLEEEINALQAAGIQFEIIPGVTSASAAAATAGIPLTRRLTARRVQFITGADVTGELPADVNMAALADPLATTVVYMGKRTFPGLVARLIAEGLPADTPAILAEAVSTPAEKVTRFTIESLGNHLETSSSTTPALILFGPLMEPGA